MGQASQQSWLSKQFAPSKLLFNFLFHGVHIGIFAYGWLVNPLDPPSTWVDLTQVEASSRSQAGRSEHADLLGMAISWRRLSAFSRWNPYPSSNV